MRRNRNYRKGVKLEYDVVGMLRARGFYAVRSAGSHSLFDVIGIKGGEVILIQCKTGKMKSKDFKEFCERGDEFCRDNVHVFLVHRDRRVWMIYYLNRTTWLDKKAFKERINEIKEVGYA